MRTAVCLSGEMRGCPECIEKLKAHVIEPFRALGAVDLFVHTRKDPWWLPASGLDFRCLWVEENRRRDASVILGKANPPHMGERDGTDRRAFLYQSYLQQYWSLAAVGDMVKRAENQDGELYDWVVRSRPDCFLEWPVPVERLTPGVVHFPFNDWWPYEMHGKRVPTATDKFAVGPSFGMSVYFDKLSWLPKFCAENRIHGEAFTVWQLDQAGVPWRLEDGLKIHQKADPYRYSERP